MRRSNCHSLHRTEVKRFPRFMGGASFMALVLNAYFLRSVFSYRVISRGLVDANGATDDS